VRPLTAPTGSIPLASVRESAPARLEFSHRDGSTYVSRCFATAPLKLLVPRTDAASAWAFASSFGGGLVAGDRVEMKVVAGPHTRCYVGTQSATKVYRSPAGHASQQHVHAAAQAHALLVWLPDPVCCFAEAVYEQRQRFDLTGTSSLVLLDWLTSGRHACGERYALTRYRSRNDIFVDGRHVVADSMLLDPRQGPLDARHRLGRFDCLATLVLMGPAVSDVAQRLLAAIAGTPVTRASALVAAASPLRDGAVVRVAGGGAEAVASFLRPHLCGLVEMLGEDPWRRKW